MYPKKDSKKSDIILAVALLVIVAYVFFAFGAALYDREVATGIGGGLQSVEEITLIFDLFEKRLVNPFPDFVACVKATQVQQSLAVGLVLWFIIIAYYLTNKKNLIHGKEYGTAKWGGKEDIQELFSESLMKAEIKKAKALRYPWGRAAEHRGVKRDCREMVDALKRADLEALEKKCRNDSDYSREAYKQEKAKILAEAKERYKLLYNATWKPRKIRLEYKAELSRIKEEREKGITIADDAAEAAAIKAAKKKMKSSLRDFWSVKRRVEKIKEKYANSDILLTQTEKICLFNYKVNGHVLIIGGSGAGKSRGYILPNTLENAGKVSFIYTDPKGELLEKAYFFLAKIKGYKVRVLNLDDKAKSDGYNPFKYIHPDRDGYEDRVQTLIETIIINTDGGEVRNSSDPFWEKAERLFLQALFFFTCDGFVEEERNMDTVLKLIAMLEIGEEEDNHDSDLDYFAMLFEQRLNEADEVNHNAGTLNIGVQTYKDFRSKASGRTAKSIVISAVARLSPFRNSGIRRILSFDTMELDRVGEELMAIFVVVPPTENTYASIAGCLFTQLFQELQYCAAQVHKHDGQRLPVPVRFMLDEQRNTCNIPNFLKIQAYARSFGCSITSVFQSLDQLKVMFKDEWGSVIDNCSSTLFLGSVSNPDALEFFSRMLGKGTYDKRSTSRTKGKQGSSTWSNDVLGRELLTADEIRRLDKDLCLLMVAGRKPFLSYKYEYKNHPLYRLTSDGNKANSIEYVPQPPPWEVKEDSHPDSAPMDGVKELEQRREAAKQRAKQTLAYINDTVDFIEICDPQELLTFVTKNFNHMDIVDNELLIVHDGEPNELDVDDELLFGEDDTLDDIVSTSYKERAKQTMERIEADISENGIEIMETGEFVKEVIKAGVNLQPTEDELLIVHDGEPNELDVDDELLFDNDVVFDEDEEAAAAQEVGDLTSQLDSLLSEYLSESA